MAVITSTIVWRSCANELPQEVGKYLAFGQLECSTPGLEHAEEVEAVLWLGLGFYYEGTDGNGYKFNATWWAEWPEFPVHD